jgi:hypothetical protein
MGPAERPLGSCWIGSRMPDEIYRATRAIPIGRVLASDIRVDDFMADYDRLYEMHEAVGDDAFWSASAFYGIPWVEAILGCPVYYSGDSFWVEPILPEWPDRLALPGPEGQEWLTKLLEFTEALVRLADGRYAVAATLMRGPSDLLAAARGHIEMIYDMYDHPEQLERLAAVATDLWIQVARRQLELIPRYEGGYVSHFYRVWAPDWVVCPQEDASASFSPEFFGRILVPADEKISAAFPYSVMHLHSPTTWPVEQLLHIDRLSCIEINYDDNGPRLTELMPVLRRIQESKPLVIRGALTVAEIEAVKRDLSPRGLLLNMVSMSVEESREQMAVLRS